ncbi:MAG: redox-regulated ATPase YchF [Lentisphaerae bacterium]|jgi:ribosome-binding ATPase|nr:redox-regulated ATPase YchF [Lentisphaerota bacterium]MBT7057788.1 redox-regulated ATPase YchF [Lentisphaerota bacterium]MBT7843207.1 redox-regulated ATPase YchF [Lentisphaerota bacterium]
MDLGIIGLPQVGKKTVFELLTGLPAERAPSRSGITYGIASVRDPRIDILSAMYNPKKTRYAEFNIALPPDIQPDAARSADWLEPLRKVDALLHVVRAFDADHVFHIAGDIDPARDLTLVETELLLADLALAETRLERIEKDAKKGLDLGEGARQQPLLERCRQHLEDERPLRTLELTDDDAELIRSLAFLTLKPVVVVLNVGEEMVEAEGTLAPLARGVEEQGGLAVLLSASIEGELTDLDDDERAVFMEDLGITEPAAHRLSRASYACLGLISYFTVGPDEVRAWAVRDGAKAPEAAGRIHSDLERGFIRADTIAYNDLIAAGDEKAGREQNLYVLNGKDYLVKDGDIMEIRFNV